MTSVDNPTFFSGRCIECKQVDCELSEAWVKPDTGTGWWWSIPGMEHWCWEGAQGTARPSELHGATEKIAQFRRWVWVMRNTIPFNNVQCLNFALINIKLFTSGKLFSNLLR